MISAIALTTAAAGMAAAAPTWGSIPGGATNNGLDDVYGGSVTTRNGWYGADFILVGGGGLANITVTFLGAEAGFTNSFDFGGAPNPDFTHIGGTGGTSGQWPLTGSETYTGVADGLLDFKFSYDINGGIPSGTVVNGSNPDDFDGNAGPNFFFSSGGLNSANPLSEVYSAATWIMLLDDGGAGDDDNHDDLPVLISVEGGTISTVPLPAAAFLLLGGLGFVSRKRKAA